MSLNVEKNIKFVVSFTIPEKGIEGTPEIYNGKKVYLVNGEWSWGATDNINEAKKFTTLEEINNLKFQDLLMSDGSVYRNGGLWALIGKDIDQERFLRIEEIDFSPTILSTRLISDRNIRVPVTIDPEFEEYQRLRKKFKV